METIKFSSAYWYEIETKLNIYKRLNILVASINILDYTSKFEHLGIVFQCFPADIKSRKVETFKKMRRKTKTLELYLALDYDTIMQGTDEENLTHMKEVFLQGCEIFLKEMKAFDWEGFKAQVGEGLIFRNDIL